jgi:hypothetical protein
VDQQTNRGAQSNAGANLGSGHLNGSRGVTPFLKDTEAPVCLSKKAQNKDWQELPLFARKSLQSLKLGHVKN